MIFEFFYGWCWNTVDILRPQIRDALGLTLTQAGSAYTAQGLGAMTGAIVLGQLADRFGRTRMIYVVVIGYGGLAAAGLLVASYPALMVQRAALGFFLGGNFPIIVGSYLGLFPPHLRGKLTSVSNGCHNFAIVALGASLSATWLPADWRFLLLAGAVPPLLLSPLLAIVPDDRRIAVWGADGAQTGALRNLPIADLFAPGLIGITVRLFLVIGLNFFAYQAFAGWVTTYLRDVRGFSVAEVGSIVAWQFAGATLGSFFWGWVADRFGRRAAAYGFFGGTLVVILYLGAVRSPDMLRLAGFIWGFMIACSVAWGPWMAELFPVHLRSTAMSIFNWGRLISMTAPLITGAVAARFGLTWAMALSAACFLIAGKVWLSLPETLIRKAP